MIVTLFLNGGHVPEHFSALTPGRRFDMTSHNHKGTKVIQKDTRQDKGKNLYGKKRYKNKSLTK